MMQQDSEGLYFVLLSAGSMNLHFFYMYHERNLSFCRMQRNRGQFTSSKSKLEDANSDVTNCEGTQHWGSIEGRPPSSAV